MTQSNNARSPGEIEAKLAADRAALANTLDELQSRVSVDYLAREALGMLKSNTSDYTRLFDGAVRSNPVAAALVGVGIAWLAFGGKRPLAVKARAPVGALHADPRRDEPWPPVHKPTLMETAEEWARDLDIIRDLAAASLRRIESEARENYAAFREGISDKLSETRDFAAERAKVLAIFATDLKSGLESGLGDLSEAAREKIIAAREQSYAAMLRAENMAKRGTRSAIALIEEHPVAAGGLALALGAVAGALLWRSAGPDADADDDQATANGHDGAGHVGAGQDEAVRLFRTDPARRNPSGRGSAAPFETQPRPTMSTA